ncbi:FAD-dependent oxidoreductase [Aspergillus lucknowensis]|uniref:FAD-binding domain-containing protein n=1 Tax=Aspergillus lucknowensis TaxID=176173 RepID=A0ABR4LN19_9EURO
MSAHVAIIGAGLSGLTLALALHQQSIACTLYEARSTPLNIGGAIMLSPNALRILDALCVFKRIRSQGYEFDHLHFRSPEDKPLDTFEFGSEEKYGYSGMRIYRHVLINELSAMAAESGIPIRYHKKFTRVLSEAESSVTWEFYDGTRETATCLVGADGIHSKVREYLYPDLEPTFTHTMAVTAAVLTKQLQVPEGYGLPVTIMNKVHGAFVIAPQQADGSEVLIGRQKRAPQLDRDGWNALLNDKEWCIDFLRDNAADFPEIVGNAVSSISTDKINLWPFYIVPKLETWSSKFSRVVILGDAAHAIPPSAGQGINQGFEDVYTFALILRHCEGKQELLQEALKTWQAGRQERVDRVLALNAEIDKRRAPKMPGQGDDEAQSKPFELGWLYKPDFTDMVDGWLAGKVL